MNEQPSDLLQKLKNDKKFYVKINFYANIIGSRNIIGYFMISVNDLKTGLTLELDNGLWSVVEFLHVKPGKRCSVCPLKA